MSVSARAGRRAVAGALGAGAIAGAMLFGTLPSALADDPALNPPNCTAADLAGVAAGVSASTSAYLFTHPDVNWFFTSLEGLPRDTVNDRIAGLEAGADDYLTKPFDLGELVARLHALLRRSSLSERSPDTMTVGPLTIDTARRLVFVEGERADLTKREFDLLAVLAENAGVVLSRQRLLELVWGYDFDVDTNVADVFISYLRRKLEREGHPRVIHTVRGIGYVLRDEV